MEDNWNPKTFPDWDQFAPNLSAIYIPLLHSPPTSTVGHPQSISENHTPACHKYLLPPLLSGMKSALIRLESGPLQYGKGFVRYWMNPLVRPDHALNEPCQVCNGLSCLSWALSALNWSHLVLRQPHEAWNGPFLLLAGGPPNHGNFVLFSL